MQLADDRLFTHVCAIQFPFFEDRFNVGVLHLVIGGDFFIAAAVGAEAFTKGQVDIQANAFLAVVLMKDSSEIVHPGLAVDAFLPFGYGRITGITGNGLVVFFQ